MNLPVFNTAFALVAFRSSVTFPRNDCGHNLSYTRVPDLLSVAAAREPYCCLSHPLGDQCDSVTYTVRIDSTPAYTALSVCTAFVPLFIYASRFDTVCLIIAPVRCACADVATCGRPHGCRSTGSRIGGGR